MKPTLILTNSIALLFVLLVSAQAFALPMVGLNFVGGRSSGGGAGGGGTDGEIVGAADVAGVVPQANWNNGFGSNNAGPVALVDDSGAATGITASWSGVPNSWTISTGGATDGNERLMNGYLDTNNSAGSTTITLDNIPYLEYDVIIYKDGDAGGGRSGDYTVNGIVQTDLREPANFPIGAPPGDGTFLQAVTGAAGNFALFEGVTGSTLTINADESASGGGFRAPINGIQIIATEVVPEPATIAIWSVFSLILAGIAVLRARRK